MALSDVNIKEFIKRGQVEIDPLVTSNIGPASYDLRSAQDVILKPREQKLVATLERINLSSSVLGILHLRSSFAREGLFASLALVDPGFRGQLTVSLLNAGNEIVKMERGEAFLQLTIIQLSSNAEKSYDGIYQDSYGIAQSGRKISAKKLANST